MSVKESLTDQEKTTLFDTWLIVRSKKDMNLSLPKFLSIIGFEPLYSVKDTEELARP
jgi:hypothetical protein